MTEDKAETCSIDHCSNTGRPNKNGKNYLRKGLCNAHYLKLTRYGDPMVVRIAKDGRGSHPLYNTWNMMLQRCNNTKFESYKLYGKRGIKVCARWSHNITGFPNFIEDMGQRPQGMSLDRIDTNGNYEPNNCRWATDHQQSSNRRSNNDRVGVSYSTKNKYWRAELTVSGSRYYKNFKEKLDAIKYRATLEKRYLTRVRDVA